MAGSASALLRSHPARPARGGALPSSESYVDLLGPPVRTLWVRASGGHRWGAARKIEAVEDGLGGVRRVDRGEKPHAAAAARALEDVDGEDASQELRPGSPTGTGPRVVGYPSRHVALGRQGRRSARLELLRGVFESDARRGMRDGLVALVYAVRAIGAGTLVASTIHDAGELERLGDVSAPVGVPLVA